MGVIRLPKTTRATVVLHRSSSEAIAVAVCASDQSPHLITESQGADLARVHGELLERVAPHKCPVGVDESVACTDPAVRLAAAVWGRGEGAGRPRGSKEG